MKKIRIKKKNKGKFTASAKKAGMGVQEYARHILANKDRYSPTLVKRANFAKNFGGRKKESGGGLNFDLGRGFLYDSTSNYIEPSWISDTSISEGQNNSTGYMEGYTPRNTPISNLFKDKNRKWAEGLWAAGELVPFLGNIMGVADVYNDIRNLVHDRDIDSGDIGNLLLDVSGLIPGVSTISKSAKLVRLGKLYKAAASLEKTVENIRYASPEGVKDVKKAISDIKDFSNRAQIAGKEGRYGTRLMDRVDASGREREYKRMVNGLLDGVDRALNPKLVQYYTMQQAGKWADATNDFFNFTGNVEDITDNQKAMGGNLTHGGYFSNGLVEIDNGGTHSENPLGGVPMGIAPDNQPNLVEQGEVIYKDYVFSNRLTPDKKAMKGFDIPSKYNGWSFAKIAEDMSKESSERPNDPISKNGLEDSMSKLMMLQEMERNKKGKKGTQQMMAYGGHRYDGLSYNPIYGMVSPFTIPEQLLQTPVLEETTPLIQNAGTTNRLNTYTNYEALPKDTDFYSPEYMAFWNRIKANPEGELAQQLLADINSGKYGNVGGNTFTIDDILRLSHDYKKGPVHQAFLAALRDYSPVERYGALEDVDFTVDNPAVVQNPAGFIERTVHSKPIGDSSKEIPEYLRYAPVVASGIGYLQSMFTNPDYEHANALMREADALRAPQVKFNPLNRYLRYNPIDRNYILNQLRGQSGATRRAISNAGTNPGTTIAGMLAADYNAQNAIGDSLIKMQQYNDNQRQMVENFNRGTDQYNSQGFLEADTFNARSRADRDARRLAYIDRALQMKEQSDAMLEATRSANATNFFNQLGQIGRENTDTNILEKLKDSDLFGALNEAMSKGLLTKAKGGKLNKKSGK